MDIIPYTDNRPSELETPSRFTSDRGATVEAVIGAWLHAKYTNKSGSKQTQKAYKTTIKAFRALLLDAGHDLLFDAEGFIPIIADFAQVFASMRSPRSRHTKPIRPATISQRLAILSSFYDFALKRQHIKAGNPIDIVDRPSVEAYARSQAIPQEEVEARLKEIDPETIQGARDLALLALLLSTGRRVSEVATLEIRHLQITGKQFKVMFEHTKGDKVMYDLLSIPVSRLLKKWLELFYGSPVQAIPGDRPLWVNVHHESRKGEQLGYHGVAGVCQHYLGTSKVHTTRHTFAILMELAGAKLTDIQRRLGHKNAATTGVYLDKLTQDRNPYADRIAASLGLEG